MEDLLNSFAKLDLNDQRNQINLELQLIGNLLKKLEIQKGITPLVDVKNYDKIKEKDISEKEMLTKMYSDIYNIERDLITLIAYELEMQKQ